MTAPERDAREIFDEQKARVERLVGLIETLRVGYENRIRELLIENVLLRGLVEEFPEALGRVERINSELVENYEALLAVYRGEASAN